jgi:murein L,D-transpeptidase YcbB/YkuD
MSRTSARPHPLPLLLLAAGAALLAAGCGGGRAKTPLPATVGQLLRTTLESTTLPAELRDQPERKRAWDDMHHFYERRLWQPTWANAGGPLPLAKEFLETIPAVAPEGIDPRRYRQEDLARRVEALRRVESFDDPQAQRQLVDTDIHLTYALMTLAEHLAAGRLQPKSLNIGWYTKPRNVDLPDLLAAVADHPEKLRPTLLGLAPPHPEYARLRAAVAAYREQAAKGEWPQVPPGPPLQRGAADARVGLLRARLAATGDLPAEAAGGRGADDAQQPPLFDQATAQAVQRFQARHGLPPTGVVDEATLAALDVTIGVRIRQMELNMERWRWMPADLGERHIEVNVPEFVLRVMEGDRAVLAMRVVVGKEQSRTPVFSDKMTYVELNPYWNIPPSILHDEILPALARDPGYLASHDMEVVSGEGEEMRVRQRPGPQNPLGRIKFMFPNDFDVYLHDTPAGHLFNQSERTFSHGCIRIERPMDLADYLLRGDPKWDRAAVEAAIAAGEQRQITLRRPIPVHILYWTAWVEKDGRVQFREDVYGHDAILDAALRAEPPLDLELPALAVEQRAAR